MSTKPIILCLIHNNRAGLDLHPLVEKVISESPVSELIKDRCTQINAGYTSGTPLINEATERLLGEYPFYPETTFNEIAGVRLNEQPGGYCYFDYEPEGARNPERFDACVRPYRNAELSFATRCVSQIRRREPDRKIAAWNCPHTMSRSDHTAARSLREIAGIDWSIVNAYHDDPMRAIYDFGVATSLFGHEVSIAIKPFSSRGWMELQTATNLGKVIRGAADLNDGSGLLYINANWFKSGVPDEFAPWIDALAEGLQP